MIIKNLGKASTKKDIITIKMDSENLLDTLDELITEIKKQFKNNWILEDKYKGRIDKFLEYMMIRILREYIRL